MCSVAHIKPATREAKDHLYYYPGPGDRRAGLAPHWTLAGLLINDSDGYRETTRGIAGEEVVTSLACSKSGFAPRSADVVGGDGLYEFE